MSAHGRAGPKGPKGPKVPGARRPQPDGPQPDGPPPDGAPPVLWALLVIAAALVGGLAAAALVHTSLIVAVIVGLVAGGLAVAVFRSSGRPAQWPPGDRPAARPPAERDGTSAARSRPAPGRDGLAGPAPTVPVSPVASPGSAVSPGSAPGSAVSPGSAPGSAVSPGSAGSPGLAPRPGETVVQLLPAQPGHARSGADKSWWDAARGAPPPPSSGAQRAPAPDLSTYLASTFIAQCPRCGAFRLDFRRARSGWDFRCESCEYIWTWQPGSPWPPVRVAPKRRRE